MSRACRLLIQVSGLLWICCKTSPAAAQPIGTQAEAAAAEARLTKQPNDHALREGLIRWYWQSGFGKEPAGSLLRAHILALARKDGRNPVFGEYLGAIPREGYWPANREGFTELAAIWRQHLEEAPGEPVVAVHAAVFYHLSEPALATDLARRAVGLAPTEAYVLRTAAEVMATVFCGVTAEIKGLPAKWTRGYAPPLDLVATIRQATNPEFLIAFGKQVMLAAPNDRDRGDEVFGLAQEAATRARAALRDQEPAVRLLLLARYSRVQLFGTTADCQAHADAIAQEAAKLRSGERYWAVRAAEAYLRCGNVSEALSRAIGSVKEWQGTSGTHPEPDEELHAASVIAATAAAKARDFTVAEEYLRLAGSTIGPGSQRAWMDGAKELIKSGRVATARAYLASCRPVIGSAKVAEWLEALDQERAPDFTGHLLIQ